MKRILFVCSGNTCRSPMAEALTNARHGDLIAAESAGVKHEPGPAHRTAVSVLRNAYDIDLSSHRSRSTHGLDMAGFDFVVALSESAANHPDLAGLGSRLLAWSIPDPWNKPDDVYIQTAEAILTLVADLARELQSDSGEARP